MRNQRLTIIESLIAIAILGLVAVTLVPAIPNFVRANRNSSQEQQITTAARTYMEDIRNQWSSLSANSLTLRSVNTVMGNSSGLSASLSITGRDADSESPVGIASCSSILTTACTATSTKQRWLFQLTLTTGGTAQSYTMELGR